MDINALRQKLANMIPQGQGVAQEDLSGREPATEEDYRELELALQQTGNFLRDIDAEAEGVDYNMKVQGQKSVQEILGILQRDGVNVQDPNAVTAYLQQLQQTDPQKFELIEGIIEMVMRNSEGLFRMGPPLTNSPIDEMQQTQPMSPSGIDGSNPVNQIPRPNTQL